MAAVAAGQAGPAAGEGCEVGGRRHLVLEPHDRGYLRHDDRDDAEHRGHPQRVGRDGTSLAAGHRMPRHRASSADTADACIVRPPT
jgi:hypothetical protein